MFQSNLRMTAVVTGMVMACLTAPLQAQEATKDIVIARLSNAPAAASAAGSRTGDAMAVSVMQENADGSMAARGTNRMFRTGDRFRVKFTPSRNGTVALYNTTPDGVLNPKPVWEGPVRGGRETVTPRLKLDGRSGVDLLHVVLRPARDNIVGWLSGWLSRAKDDDSIPASADDSAKDIRLDVQHTDNVTYLLNPAGQGLVTTIRIAHR